MSKLCATALVPGHIIRTLPRLLNPTGEPPAGEWEEGFVYVDDDQSDTVDGYVTSSPPLRTGLPAYSNR